MLGPEKVQMQSGLSLDDITFLRSFRGSLTAGRNINIASLRETIRSELLADFYAKDPLIEKKYHKLNQRQRFILFLMLRTHGSFSTYAVRSNIPKEVSSLLFSHRGNCSDHAVRLAMVLDIFGIHSAIVPIKTTSLPGHVIVDAFDSVEKTSYLLDSNTNVFIMLENTSGGFFEEWLKVDQSDRMKFLDDSHTVLFLPVYYRYVDGGIGALSHATLSADFINRSFKSRRDKWRKMLTVEIEEVLSWWHDSYPYQPPRSLKNVVKSMSYKELIPYAQHGLDVRPLWSAAGLVRFDPDDAFSFKHMTEE